MKKKVFKVAAIAITGLFCLFITLALMSATKVWGMPFCVGMVVSCDAIIGIVAALLIKEVETLMD